MSKGPLAGGEILLVEDEVMLRKRLAAFLAREGAEVTAVGTLAEARNAASSMPFDYAILDINLPDGSGLDLLREGAFGGATTVVVMTAEGSVKVAVEATKLGAADFLSKPVDPEALALVLVRARKAGQTHRLTEYAKARQANFAAFLR